MNINFNFLEAKCDCKKKEKPRFQFKIGLPINKGENKMIDISITNEQKVQVTLAPVTSTGKPAGLDGKPTWTIQSGDSTLAVADDGLSAFLISAETPGDTVILLEADADLGAGVETISESLQLHVLGAKAANFGVVVGTAVPK